MVKDYQPLIPHGSTSFQRLRLTLLRQTLFLMGVLSATIVVVRLVLTPTAVAPIVMGAACSVVFWWMRARLQRVEQVPLFMWIVVVLISVATWFVAWTTKGIYATSISVIFLTPSLIGFLGGTRYLWRFTFATLGVLICTALFFFYRGDVLPGAADLRVDSLLRMAVLSLILLSTTYVVYLYELEQRRSSESLARSEERYALALAGTHDAVYDWHVDEGFCHFSPQFQQVLGYGPGELTAASPFVPELYPPEEYARVQSALALHMAGQQRFELEAPLYTASGESVWFEIRGAISRREGAPRRMVGSIRDITVRKKLEVAKQEFISNMSHELRTPLTSILGSLRIVNELTTPSPQQAMLLGMAERNGQRLLRLVNDMLDLQRLQSNTLSLLSESVDVISLCREALELHEPLAHKRELRLMLDAPERAKPVLGDPERLHQVLGNLLSNAIKHSPEGDRVLLRVKAHSEEISVEVEDHGDGIPEVFQEHLFERYSRWDDEQKLQGTGLGLAIAKQIVAAHGGSISFQSKPHVLTSFVVTLPYLVDVESLEPSLQPGGSGDSLPVGPSGETNSPPGITEPGV